MNWKERIGARSPAIPNWVERGAVKKFAHAIGDPNPLYLDEAVGRGSRWGGCIAPPTFPRVFEFGVIEGLELPRAGLIHGEQKYTYARPLWVGEEVRCLTHLKDVYEKEGKGGTMTFLVFERVGESPVGESIFTAEEVLIVTAAVREGLQG
jgi:acyl dehydratase